VVILMKLYVTDSHYMTITYSLFKSGLVEKIKTSNPVNKDDLWKYKGNSKRAIYYFLYSTKGTQEQIHCHFSM